MSTVQNVLVDTSDFTPLDREAMVDLGNSLKAPLGEVLDNHNPNCRQCSQGLQYYTHEGTRKRRICGCGVAATRKRLLGDAPTAPVGRAVKAAVSYDKVKQRVAQLEAEKVKTEAAVVARLQGVQDGIADAENDVKAASDACDSARGLRIERNNQLDRLRSQVREAERVCEEATVLFTKKQSALCDANRTRRALYDRENAQRASAEPLKHRVKRLEDRIALIKQQNPEAFK